MCDKYGKRICKVCWDEHDDVRPKQLGQPDATAIERVVEELWQEYDNFHPTIPAPTWWRVAFDSEPNNVYADPAYLDQLLDQELLFCSKHQL